MSATGKSHKPHRRGKKRRFVDEGTRSENKAWVEHVKANHHEVELDFADYDGEKLHELPPDFAVAFKEARGREHTREEDIGVTEFIGKGVPGFTGILKHRFADFVVHEVDPAGSVVRLTSLDLIPVPKMPDANHEFPAYDTLADGEKALFSALTWTRLVQLAKKYLGKSDKPGNRADAIKVDVTGKSKEDRRAMHDKIRACFPNLASNVDTDAATGVRKFTAFFNGAPSAGSRDGDEGSWPRDRPKFLAFRLYKEGADSTAVFGALAKIAGVHNSKFMTAGTKDKRARTTQRVAVAMVTDKKLKRCVDTLRKSRNMRVFAGDFSYQPDGIELGQLSGNRFEIAIRDVTDPHEAVDNAMRNLRDNGFINYFGLQRFGTVAESKTSDIGLALIKSDWQRAVELILKPRLGESAPMTRMRAHWWMYRRPADAVVLLGNRLSQARTIEGTLLNAMAGCHDNDLVGALSALQKNTKLLYLHAYQSLIWNKVVSRRFAAFGTDLLVGDLVLPAGNGAADEAVCLSKRQAKAARLVEVTADNIGRYSLADVVMPVPGFKVDYPKNDALKSFYVDALRRDGLDGFEALDHKIDFFALPGDYRHVVSAATGVDWRFVRYDDPSEDLVLSDVDVIHKKALGSVGSAGKYEAVILEFTLPSSTYATVALREAMKMDMGKGVHLAMTESHVANSNANGHGCDGNENNGMANGGDSKKAKGDGS